MLQLKNVFLKIRKCSVCELLSQLILVATSVADFGTSDQPE